MNVTTENSLCRCSQIKMRSSWTRVDSKSITNLMDMSLNKPPEILEGREAWRAAVHGVAKIRKRFSNWTTTITKSSDRCPKNITWGHRNTETQMILPQNAEAETEWCGCKPRNAWVCPSSRKLAERHATNSSLNFEKEPALPTPWSEF